MKKLVAEWVKKAEGDVGTAKREAKVKEAATNWDAVCFHAQQAVEKYLKGLLQKNEITFSKTHDLSVLLNLILPVFPDLKKLSDDLEWLSAFAVEFRYPGEEAVEEDAKFALAIMDRALALLRPEIQDLTNGQ
ncbi:MAG: HEPN domain-containing protein [Deltaproteobacteria bacterium]|nr:HEPN domain-containing protein [Deltaproteobacteria bacterium]